MSIVTILKDYDHLRYVSVLGTMGLLLFSCFVDLSVLSDILACTISTNDECLKGPQESNF